MRHGTVQNFSRRAGHFRFARPLAVLGLATLGLLAWRVSMAEAPLQGVYFLGGKTLLDAPAGEPRDSHLYMELTGPSAKALYGRMKSRPSQDPCGDEGDVLKTLGNIQCVHGTRSRTYQCWLGIDLAGQRLAPGRVC